MHTLCRWIAVSALSWPACCQAHAKAFFVDAAIGKDTNPGTSPSAAWATLQAVNEHKFGPGDQILFHAGQSWAGVLAPHGSGTAEDPIVIASYGDGAKPLLKGEGADATVVLKNVSGWTVQDIAVTNHGATQARRIGIVLETTGHASALHVVRVDVSDVNGMLSKKAGGIAIRAAGKDGKQAYFDDVLIADSVVSHIAGDGIFLEITTEEQRTYLNTHVRLTGNTITDIGKNAIYLRGTLDGLIDHNIVTFAGAREHGNAICIGWSKHTIVRENEVSQTGLHTGTGDNGAIDVDDGAIEAVVERNWSHDNVGGAVNVFTEPNRDCDAVGTIIRYNLSENDGIRVFGVHGVDRQTAIYNNTVYVGKGHSPNAVQSGRYGHHPELPDGILFTRNVFFVEGKLTFDWQGKNIMTGGNCYFGNAPKSPLPDKEMVKEKGLKLLDAPIHDRREAHTYGIPDGSACGSLLPALPNADGEDFLGHKIPAAEKGMRGAVLRSQNLAGGSTTRK